MAFFDGTSNSPFNLVYNLYIRPTLKDPQHFGQNGTKTEKGEALPLTETVSGAILKIHASVFKYGTSKFRSWRADDAAECLDSE